MNISGNRGDKRVDQESQVDQKGTFAVGGKQKQVAPGTKDSSDLSAQHVSDDANAEAHLVQREAEVNEEVLDESSLPDGPVGDVFSIPELLQNILSFASTDSVKSMMTVSKEVSAATKDYTESAEGKARDVAYLMNQAREYEVTGDLDKAMMLYAEHAGHDAGARKRLEVFCLGLKAFSPALRNLSKDDLAAMSVHDLIVATADALEAFGALNRDGVKSALYNYCDDVNIPLADREAVLDAFFDSMMPVLGAKGGRDGKVPLRQAAREIALKYPEAFLKAYDSGRVSRSFAVQVYRDQSDWTNDRRLGRFVKIGWDVDGGNLIGDPQDRERSVRGAVELGLRLGMPLASIIKNTFEFKTGEYNVGMAGYAMLGLETLPTILAEKAEAASSEAEVLDVIDGIRTMLKSDFSAIGVQDRVKLVRVLISLMPKVESPEVRSQIIELFESQMHASTLYRMAKGVGEGLMALMNQTTEGLFEGEIDDYVGTDLAAVFLSMSPEERDAWIESGGDYYVGLALESIPKYLDGLEFASPEDRNKLEAEYVAVLDGIMNDFEGRSSALRGAASVALNAIAQSTSDLSVMQGQAYLDALEG